VSHRAIAACTSLGVLVAAATLGAAAPAAAESSDYLNALAPRYTFLSESQLLSAGNKACASARSGVPASDNVILVSKDLGVSTATAWEIVVNAINHLGC
jgi:uncharacterized protein DUF732